MARQDIYKDGVNTQFSSTYQPEKKGRRKNKLFEFIDKERVSREDLQSLLQGLAYNYSFADLENIHNPASGREDLPVVVALVMKAMMTDHRKGSIETLEKILDRVYGKPTHTVEVNAPPGLSITMLSHEERQARIDELLKKGGLDAGRQ